MRQPERRLLTAVFLSVGAGYLIMLLIKLSNAPALDLRELIPAGAFLASLLLVHLGFAAMGFRGDPVLAPVALFLAGLGLLTRYRMGVYDLTDLTRLANYAFPLGVAALLITVAAFRRGRWRMLEPLAFPSAVAACAVLLAILAAGHRFRGAVYLPGNLNPSEAVKILLAVFLAGFLAPRRESFARSVAGVPLPSPADAGLLLVLWAAPMALIVLQRDLGMLVLLGLVLVLLLFVATGRWAYPVGGAVILAAAAWALFMTIPHVQQRVMAWHDPFADPTGRSWQILQGLSALYAGGPWGTGLGAGFPHTIPIASSDFIYAAIGEELGYAGCAIVLVFFGVFFHRGLGIAGRARSPFGALLAAALVLELAVQTLLNIGGVVKAIPVTGITLPFISHGGSSLVVSFVALGLILAVSEGEPSSATAGGAASRRRPRRPRRGKAGSEGRRRAA